MTMAPSSGAGILASVPPNLPIGGAQRADDDDVIHGVSPGSWTTHRCGRCRHDNAGPASACATVRCGHPARRHRRAACAQATPSRARTARRRPRAPGSRRCPARRAPRIARRRAHAASASSAATSCPARCCARSQPGVGSSVGERVRPVVALVLGRRIDHAGDVARCAEHERRPRRRAGACVAIRACATARCGRRARRRRTSGTRDAREVDRHAAASSARRARAACSPGRCSRR